MCEGEPPVNHTTAKLVFPQADCDTKIFVIGAAVCLFVVSEFMCNCSVVEVNVLSQKEKP